MQLTISDQMIKEFLSGLLVVVILICVGALLSLILSKSTKLFPFTRLALILGITPFSLIHFIHQGHTSTLYLFSMTVLLLGITVDGIAHLLARRSKETAVEHTIETEPPSVDPVDAKRLHQMLPNL